MKKINDNLIKKIRLVVIAIVFAIFASYVSAGTSRPNSIDTVGTNILNVGSVDQVKSGQISVFSFLAGDTATSNSANIAVINSSGSMAVGASTIPTGIALDVQGTTGILGTIRSTSIAFAGGSGTLRPVCVSDMGILLLCGKAEYRPSTTQTAGSDSVKSYFVVPSGVSSITVEMYGGGGAGYGPDNYKYPILAHGDESYFKSSSSTLVAGGGKSPIFQTTAGTGGSNSTSGSVSVITDTAGGDGNTTSSLFAGALQNIANASCLGQQYFLNKGPEGLEGGNGGSSAGSGLTTSGSAGNGGDTNAQPYPWSTPLSTICDHQEMTSGGSNQFGDLSNRKGGDGVDGILGTGGSGFGGRGGSSVVTDAPASCGPFGSECNAQDGGAGGGGAGYIKATISVTAGEIFHLQAGGGGKVQGSMKITGTTVGTSGNGGDGYIKVTY